MKYNKGFAPLILVAIIVGALVIGGGAYYFGKSKGEDKKVVENPNVENQVVDNSEDTKGVDQVNKNIEKKGIKTQVNVNAGYQVEYPSDWYVKSSDTKMSSNGNYGYNAFTIQNTKDAVLPGSDFSLRTNGTQIQISVNTNMNYSNYEEFIKDPKTDLPKSAKDQRLAGLEMVNIGGKTLQAFTGLKVPDGTTPGMLYNFIYNNKQYSISIESGSEEQFNKDKKVFEDMVSSFKFLDSEESPTEVFNNQPGSIKSILVNKTKDGFETGNWTLSVDLLSSNPNWIPGDDSTGYFFLNQNTKVRNLNMTENTKTYNCGGIGSPSILANTSSFISNIQDKINKAKTDPGLVGHFGYTAYFDITGTNITVIYEQCLP